MAGLVHARPGHPRPFDWNGFEDVDARNKCGHDESEIVAVGITYFNLCPFYEGLSARQQIDLKGRPVMGAPDTIARWGRGRRPQIFTKTEVAGPPRISSHPRPVG